MPAANRRAKAKKTPAAARKKLSKRAPKRASKRGGKNYSDPRTHAGKAAVNSEDLKAMEENELRMGDFRILHLRAAGKSLRSIGATVGLSHHTIGMRIRKAKAQLKAQRRRA